MSAGKPSAFLQIADGTFSLASQKFGALEYITALPPERVMVVANFSAGPTGLRGFIVGAPDGNCMRSLQPILTKVEHNMVSLRRSLDPSDVRTENGPIR